MNCKDFQNELPDLVMDLNQKPSLAAAAHLVTCPPCTEQYRSYQQTFAALDAWTAPEPSAYFDQKMHVRLREEQASPKMSWMESLVARFQFNTGRQFRPAMAGAFALALVLGGGGVATFNHANTPVQASATVTDLQILDHNEQAFEQLDQLQQDEDSAPTTTNQQDAPQTDSPTT